MLEVKQQDKLVEGINLIRQKILKELRQQVYLLLLNDLRIDQDYSFNPLLKTRDIYLFGLSIQQKDK